MAQEKMASILQDTVKKFEATYIPVNHWNLSQN